jgi:hypothetical protein
MTTEIFLIIPILPTTPQRTLACIQVFQARSVGPFLAQGRREQWSFFEAIRGQGCDEPKPQSAEGRSAVVRVSFFVAPHVLRDPCKRSAV